MAYILSLGLKKFQCEVKLMCKGNPESADAVIARDSNVFIADKLSDLNKRQLNDLDIQWVELRGTNGFKRFGVVLKNLGIPHQGVSGNVDQKLDEIYKDLF